MGKRLEGKLYMHCNGTINIPKLIAVNVSERDTETGEGIHLSGSVVDYRYASSLTASACHNISTTSFPLP
jgi:hypothetical protein